MASITEGFCTVLQPPCTEATGADDLESKTLIVLPWHAAVSVLAAGGFVDDVALFEDALGVEVKLLLLERPVALL